MEFKIRICAAVIYFSLQFEPNFSTIVYPPGAGNKIQFIVGIGIPASDLSTVQSVSWGYVIKTNYALPTNLSFYRDPPTHEDFKRESPFTRMDLYYTIEDAINRSGLPGKHCLMRAICEASKIQFDTTDLVGELFHVLLQPSITLDTDTDYYYAEMAGRSKYKNCSELYSACSISLLDLFTIIEERDIPLKYHKYVPPIFPMK